MNYSLKGLPQEIKSLFDEILKKYQRPDVHERYKSKFITQDGKSIGDLLYLVEMASNGECPKEAISAMKKLLEFTEGPAFKPDAELKQKPRTRR